jgi:hypothetical protein
MAAVPPRCCGRCGASSCARAASSTRASPATTAPSSRGRAWSSPRCANTSPATRCAPSTGTSRRAWAGPSSSVTSRSASSPSCSRSTCSGSSRSARATASSELVSELASVLALAAVRNNDRVGLLLLHRSCRARRTTAQGTPHALRCGICSPCARAATWSAWALPHRSVVFVCSDFVGDDYERPLSLLAQRHDVIAVSLSDPAETELPHVGVARFVDPETEQIVELDTNDPAVRAWLPRRCTPKNRAAARCSRDSALMRLSWTPSSATPSRCSASSARDLAARMAPCERPHVGGARDAVVCATSRVWPAARRVETRRGADG